MDVYESIVQGLEEALEHAKGQRELRIVSPAVLPLKEFAPAEIREIRVQLGLTQVIFAGFMGVSIKTVEAWEAGRNKPEGPARRMLSMIQNDPTIILQFVQN